MTILTNSEAYAFNRDLDRYQRDEIAADKRDAFTEDAAKELMEGEYSPFIPKNVQEAISEMSFADACMLSAYVGTAAKLKDNNSAQVNLADFVVRICNEYWYKLAKDEAETQYDKTGF